MKFRVKIKASFDFETEVDASDSECAKAKASNALMDYLDLEIRKTKEFDYFHEYLLQEEIAECIPLPNHDEPGT